MLAKNVINTNLPNKNSKNKKKQKIESKEETGQYYDDTINPTNSCFDEQSFFKNASASNKLQNSISNEYRKVSGGVIKDLFDSKNNFTNKKEKEKDKENNIIKSKRFLNFDDLLYFQTANQQNHSQMNNNIPNNNSNNINNNNNNGTKIIINNIINRNSYTNTNTNNNTNTYNINNTPEIKKIRNSSNKAIKVLNNDKKEKLEKKNVFKNFLEREKKYEKKMIENKQKRMKLEEKEILSNIQAKPCISQKSAKLAQKIKNNTNNKVYDRLYNIAFSTNKKTKLINDINVGDKTNIDNNINNTNTNNNLNNTEIKNNKNVYNKKTYSYKKLGSTRKNLKYEFFKNDSLNNSNMKLLNDNNKQNEIKKKNSYTNQNISKKCITNIINQNREIISKYKKLVKKDYEDKLFNDYNTQSASEKLSIVQISKINSLINNYLEALDKNEPKKKKTEINFENFCDLLFKLGYVYIHHTKIKSKDIKSIINSEKKNENNSDDITNFNSEEALFHTFFNKSLLTNNFINNELKIINEAFNSIINNFKISPESKNNSDKTFEEFISLNYNKVIHAEDFKLFVFILSNIFLGYKNEKEKNDSINVNNNDNNMNNKSNHFLRTSRSTLTIMENVHNNNNILPQDDINKNDTKINNLIKKIIRDKKISSFSAKDITEYKNYFSYLINIKNEYTTFLNNVKKIMKKQKIEEYILNPCTFNPKTNKNKDSILNSIKPNMNHEERNKVLSQKKIQHKKELEKELHQEFSKQCPFNPKLNRDKSAGFLIKSMKKEKSKLSNKDKDEKNTIESIEIDDVLKFTLNSKVKEPFKTRMFTESPLMSDKLVNDKIKTWRNFNYSKKMKNLEKNNREIISEDVKKNKLLINYLLNNVNEKRMNLSIEIKSNKDYTFDKFKKKKLYKSPLFTLKVNINKKGNNESDVIEVFPKDDYEKLCFNFCMEHNLGKNSYNKILETIKNTLKGINDNSI